MGIAPCRFPDSEIPGSKPVSGSPRLIAAVHVLLRLPAPRHPPCALSSLTVPLRRIPSAATGTPLRSRSRTGSITITWCDYAIAFPLGCLRFSCQRTAPPPENQRWRNLDLGRRPRIERGSAPHEASRGGADRVRTDDPRLAKPMLSQLSYSPIPAGRRWLVAGRGSRQPDPPPSHYRPRATNYPPLGWAWAGSNCRPHAYQACALTT